MVNIIHVNSRDEDRIFLVIENSQAYLLNYRGADFGYLCPCCLFDGQKEAITGAINKAREAGLFAGKIIWCCHQNDVPEFGDSIKYPPWLGLFKGDELMANRLSGQTCRQLKEEWFSVRS